MLFDFRTGLQAQTDPLPAIQNEAAGTEPAAEAREGMELNGKDGTTTGAGTQESCCTPYVPEDIPAAAIEPEQRTLIPSEFDEVKYWTEIGAQVDAIAPPQSLGPLIEHMDLYADAAIALALTRVFTFAVTLPQQQYERLSWIYAAELSLAKLRRLA